MESHRSGLHFSISCFLSCMNVGGDEEQTASMMFLFGVTQFFGNQIV